MARLVALSLIALAVCTLTGCDGLDEFETREDEVFAGTIIGQREAGCTAEPCSFVRRGFPEDMAIELTFSPRNASSNPGTITSSEGPCGAFFNGDRLLPIAPLAHDDLSLFEFPGARLQNYIFAIEPAAGPLVGRDVMSVLSLREDGAIELRLLSGSGARVCEINDCDAFARGECDVFGVFDARKER
ncbi:MAG: hypothetical protein AAF411_23490 [Myxococcota bacterium]